MEKPTGAGALESSHRCSPLAAKSLLPPSIHPPFLPRTLGPFRPHGTANPRRAQGQQDQDQVAPAEWTGVAGWNPKLPLWKVTPLSLAAAHRKMGRQPTAMQPRPGSPFLGFNMGLNPESPKGTTGWQRDSRVPGQDP